MSNLIPFQFNTSSVRVVTTDDGEILFVANDIATALGYSNPQKAVRDHCKKAKPLNNIKVNESFTLHPQTTLIPESDVYRLTLRSKLESAETFQDWLVEEVIPSIRKTGSYSTQPNLPETKLEWMMLAVENEKAKQALQIQVETQAQEIEILEPKAQALDRLSAADGSFCLTDAAKTLGMPPMKFNAYLSSIKWIYKRAGCTTWIAYQDKIQAGYLDPKPYTKKYPDGSEKVFQQVMVTAKGLTKLSTLLNTQPTLLERAISLVTGNRNGLVSMKGAAK